MSWKRLVKVRSVEFNRRQLGWQCVIYFRLKTAGQFTDEERAVEAFSESRLLPMIWAYFAARKKVAWVARCLGAKAGEREAKGWVA